MSLQRLSAVDLARLTRAAGLAARHRRWASQARRRGSVEAAAWHMAEADRLTQEARAGGTRVGNGQ